MASVSVIIPTYNRAQVLAAAVESVLAQTVLPDEILIVDDGSTDETAAVCARFPAPVRYIKVENGGAGRARNIGLEEARGEWIALLDSDDQWVPEKLEVQLAVLSEHPRAEWSISDFRLMDADGRLLAAPGFESCFALFRDLGRSPAAVFGDVLTASRSTASRRDDTVFVGDPFDLLFLGNFGLPSTALIRSSLIARTGGFDPSFRVAGDNEFFHRLAAHGEVAIIMSPLAVWRVGRSDKLSGSSNTPELIANAYRSMELASSLRPLGARARSNYATSRRLLARRLAYERLSQYRPGDARRTIWRSMASERDTSAKAVALLGASLLPSRVLRMLHEGKRALSRNERRQARDSIGEIEVSEGAMQTERFSSVAKPLANNPVMRTKGSDGWANSAHLGGVWTSGLRLGARTVRREPILGLKRLLLPTSYWRYAEFRFALRWLRPARGARLLDVGSPKDLAVILAAEDGAEVVATDILDSAINLAERYARAQDILGVGPGRLCAEVQDGRALPYESDSFDGAFSISVLEHIPDHGDSATIRELARVVRPGGVLVITVPFDARYRETFVNHDVYERSSMEGQPVFYERHYDREALQRRLIENSGCQLVALELWGETHLRVESILNAAGVLRTVLSPLEALLSRVALRRVAEGDGHPMAAFVVLRKPRMWRQPGELSGD